MSPEPQPPSSEQSDELFNFDELAQSGSQGPSPDCAPAIEDLLKSLGSTQLAVESFTPQPPPPGFSPEGLIGEGTATAKQVAQPTFEFGPGVSMGLSKATQRGLWIAVALLAALFLLNTILVFSSRRSDDELREGLLALTQHLQREPAVQEEARPAAVQNTALGSAGALEAGVQSPGPVGKLDHHLLALRAEFEERFARIEASMLAKDGVQVVQQTYALLALIDALPVQERAAAEGRASFLLADGWSLRALPTSSKPPTEIASEVQQP